jgi:hypothetical protein
METEQNKEKMKQKYSELMMTYVSLASEELPPHPKGKGFIGKGWKRKRLTNPEPVATDQGLTVSVDESNEIHERPDGLRKNITEKPSPCMETKVTIPGKRCLEIPATPSNFKLE